jgi:hypothetical protein
MSESGGAIAFLNSEARVQLCHAQAHKGVTLSVATMSFADSNTYYSWCIPEYHDDQRFHDGNAASEDYGPIAHTFANPKLSTLNDHTMFDHAYINVAIVDVESGPLPDPYGKLGLKQANNCLYLMHHDPIIGKASFRGLMVALPPGTMTCPTAPAVTDGTPLDVEIQEYSNNYSDYPPVARFVEGRGGRTLIGIQCTNRWCVVGPRGMGSVPDEAHHGVGDIPANSRSAVKGWFDDQVTGVPDLMPKFKIHRKNRASLIPDQNLGNLHIADYLSGYKRVGLAYLPSAPPAGSKYAMTFGLEAGINRIELRAQQVPKPGGPSGALDTLWFAQVTTQNGRVTSDIITNRTDHSKWLTSMPATARWRWDDADEDIWVQCDVGCCLINGRLL